MSTDAVDPQSGVGDPSRRGLWAVLDVTVENACPLTTLDRPISSVRTQQIGDTCECEVVTEGTPDVLRLERERGEDCLADLFHRHDCLPDVTGVRDQSLRIAVHPPDRETMAALVSDIRTAGYPVRTERIRDFQSADGVVRSLALIDRSVLTDKQRQAVELAVASGYYDETKRATLETIARELDISQSALSRRLRAAEAKLLRGVFGDGT